MSFSPVSNTTPVVTDVPVQNTVPQATSKPQEEKVNNVMHELFNNSIFKQVMSVIGYVAVALGSVFMLDKIGDALSGKKIGVFPADEVAKAGVETLGTEAKKYIDKELKAEPLPKNIAKAILEFQKEAKFRKDMEQI